MPLCPVCDTAGHSFLTLLLPLAYPMLVFGSPSFLHLPDTWYLGVILHFFTPQVLLIFASEYFSISLFPAFPILTAIYTLVVSWANYVHGLQTAFPLPRPVDVTAATGSPLPSIYDPCPTPQQGAATIPTQATLSDTRPSSCDGPWLLSAGESRLQTPSSTPLRGWWCFLVPWKEHLLSFSSGFPVLSRYCIVVGVSLSHWTMNSLTTRLLFHFCSQSQVHNKNWIYIFWNKLKMDKKD